MPESQSIPTRQGCSVCRHNRVHPSIAPAWKSNLPHATEPIFVTANHHAVEFASADIPRLQSFFDANPAYFIAVTGRPASPTEAECELAARPPEGWPYTRRWLLGFCEPSGVLDGMVDIVSDLLAPGVWHIGLLIVATRLHSGGIAKRIYAGIERWAQAGGARWMRLGVVVGNTRAERFWERCGFRETRQRIGVPMGDRVNTIRVMVKPLGDSSLDQYLATVPRDRPESA